jgi:hypothetical protein
VYYWWWRSAGRDISTSDEDVAVLSIGTACALEGNIHVCMKVRCEIKVSVDATYFQDVDNKSKL